MSGLQEKRWFFFVLDAENVEHLAEHGIQQEKPSRSFLTVM
jgi:hypothetical protein